MLFAGFAAEFGVVAAAARRAGAELVTEIEHSVGGVRVCHSRWSCVILGQQLDESELRSIRAAPPWPDLPTSNGPTSSRTARTMVVGVASTAAHIWEACIQDPTHGRQLKEMVSPHTDALVAEKAGFPARTLTGVCLLGRVVSALSDTLGFHLRSVRRIAASFAAPVYIDTDVEVILRWWPACARCAFFFEVLCLEAEEHAKEVVCSLDVGIDHSKRQRAIRDGYVEWDDEMKVSLGKL